MKILSISVRNYRVLHDADVVLDPARTLIGGPNESGKSTLIEAAHRALFLRYKTTGETQNAMTSNGGGQPSVSVEFEVEGKRYQISKRFSGQSGTAVLTQEGGVTLKADEAESRLAELLGVSGSGGKSSLSQWAHLWVWQGKSSEDPTGSANAQVDTLLEQFQRSGAAVVRQSPLDGKVAQKFARAVESLFTKPGSIRKHSPLAAAVEKHEQATAALARAESAQEKLYAAARDLELAQQAITDSMDALADTDLQAKVLTERRNALTTLRTSEQVQHVNHANAVSALTRAQAAEDRIGQLRRAIHVVRDSMAPLRARSLELTALEHRAKTQADEVAKQIDDVANRLRVLRHHAVLAGLHVQRHELHADRALLGLRLTEIEKLQADRQSVLLRIAKLPPVTTEQLEHLTAVHQLLSVADAQLSAMAAGVELLTSGGVARLDDAILVVGERRILTADGLLSIGEEVRLRITPGGGASLGEARERRDAALRALEAGLDALGVASIAAATDARNQRQSLEEERGHLELRLAESGAVSVDADRTSLEQEISKVDADLERRSALGGDHAAPHDLTRAIEQQRMLSEELDAEESVERSLVVRRSDAASVARDASEARELHQRTLQVQEEELRGAENDLAGLLSVHGDDASRASELEQLFATAVSCEQALSATILSVAGLQPELLDLDEERVARARKRQGETRFENEQIAALSRQTLAQDGSRDPHAELEAARDLERDSLEDRTRMERHAEAIVLLNDLFTAEQASVASQFATPLREKVSGYLQCLFGPSSTVQLNYDGDQLSGLGLERRSDVVGAYPFAALSGGAQQQLAAALRLGVAEVLAAGHGGSLPVIFDDAFAFSDPQRLEGLQRMLDLGAERGLQVVVLTCTPREYARFGAREVVLRATPTNHRASNITTSVEADEALDDVDATFVAPPSYDNAVLAGLRQEFLDGLSALGGRCGSMALRSALGWEPSVYEQVKQQLREEGEIMLGRGRGGSLRLASLEEE